MVINTSKPLAYVWFKRKRGERDRNERDRREIRNFICLEHMRKTGERLKTGGSYHLFISSLDCRESGKIASF
jgi:hypothetical protein